MTAPDYNPHLGGSARITDRAAVFFEKRHFGEWNSVDQGEFEAWLEESSFHRVAYLRLEGIAAYADHLSSNKTFSWNPNALQLAPTTGSQFDFRRVFIPFAAAASVALIAAVGVFVAPLLSQPKDRTDSTDIGGRTLLSFADHTQIELNTNTSIRFRITTAERTVWLKKGEAWFRVSHDAAHPFTVFVDGHRITDLGTEFVVRRDTADVDVMLLNGRATFSAAGPQVATLTPGDEALATPMSLTVTKRSPQQLADSLAWRHGMLVFRNARLSDVVREFNRYNTTKLVIADPSIANLMFSAELRTDDFEAFLNLAQNMLNLHADREGDNILIYRAIGKKMRATRAKRGS